MSREEQQAILTAIKSMSDDNKKFMLGLVTGLTINVEQPSKGE